MRKGLWKCKKKHLTKFKSIYGNKLGNTLLRNTLYKKLAFNLLNGEKLDAFLVRSRRQV